MLNVIDCDAYPSIPKDERWSVVKHQKGGAFKWEKEIQKTLLYVSSGQSYPYITGHELLTELTEKRIPVLNACVLDYLLDHSHLMPEEWKVYREAKDEDLQDLPEEFRESMRYSYKKFYFWGTIFSYQEIFFRHPYWNVAYLSWDRNHGWYQGFKRLNECWIPRSFAVHAKMSI